MNAFELADAAFDTANDYQEETVKYIKSYADALDVLITDEIAEKILECRKKFREETEKNGEGQNNYYWHVEEPLSSINLD